MERRGTTACWCCCGQESISTPLGSCARGRSKNTLRRVFCSSLTSRPGQQKRLWREEKEAARLWDRDSSLFGQAGCGVETFLPEKEGQIQRGGVYTWL